MKKGGLILITFGLALLLYGLFMDTSVDSPDGDRYHNVGLMNDRLSFLITGGFVFLGGMGLFALWKTKQSKEEEAAEERASQEKLANQAEAFQQKLSAIDSTFKEFLTRIPRDSIGIRLAGAFIAGGVIALTSRALPGGAVIGWSFFLISIYIAFRRKPARAAVFPLWAILAVLLVSAWFGMIVFAVLTEDTPNLVTTLALVISVVPVISGYFLFPRFNKGDGLSFVLKFIICFLGVAFLLGFILQFTVNLLERV